ncbi:hypothetical protein C8024_04125 [Sphingopyxis sp. BSNA05]|uniref:hypothetical protein n=1 Tax=Sphingopyxis sp. BSNA05 TaxID=1236614 RepID=UPI001563CD55|nr:hypothetical protein [Sphingopyxis sp. BSNA05]NRD88816.1 hypothetical protein [Sphingopyxis sp. BSNA05]
MGRFTTFFKPVGLALAACALSAPASTALAQPEFAEEQPHASGFEVEPAHHLPLISNIARAEWDIGGQRQQKPSNRVDIQIVQPPSDPLDVMLFHFADPPGAEQFPIAQTMCRSTRGSIPIELSGAFAGTPRSPASVVPTDSIRAGEPLIISIKAANRNLDPRAIESFDIYLTTPTGDREQINIVETAPDSGRFVGLINTAAVPPAPVQGDCVLSVKRGETFDITVHEMGGNAIGSAKVGILIDPFGEIFDSSDGTPVSGARVTLIDIATGQPAQVFGDDGVSLFPSTVISGEW